MIEIYAKYVLNGTRTIESVPELIREQVAERIAELKLESEE